MPAKAYYEAGKGKPPKQTQFQKGQSGNPGGRPGPVQSSRRRFKQALDKALQSIYWELCKERGDWNKFENDAVERLAHQIVVSAAQGDSRKISILLSLMEKLEDAKTETVSDAESSFSLSEGKSQGKNENLMLPTPQSNRPMITIGGKECSEIEQLMTSESAK